MSEGHIASWWHELEDGRVQCDLCPRYCKLRDWQRGFCFVRQNVGGALYLTTYGRSSGFAVDPVEKKPLNHFLPGSLALSFGTAGCNLGCKFCQNWEISTSREFDRLATEASPSQIAQQARALGCASIAFTYNGPVIFAEYAIDTAKACRAFGIRPIAVTAGYINPEARGEFFGHMAAANVDLKGFSDSFYRQVTGARLETVLETLVQISRSDCWLEITTLLIPGLNDSEAELESMSRWIVTNLGPDIPHHFTAFHPAHRMQDLSNTPLKTLQLARAIAVQGGERYVYTGNTFDPESQSTYCPGCRDLVIWRGHHSSDPLNLRVDENGQGTCGTCGFNIAGVFA